VKTIKNRIIVGKDNYKYAKLEEFNCKYSISKLYTKQAELQIAISHINRKNEALEKELR
jgi:hypothetical protein